MIPKNKSLFFRPNIRSSDQKNQLSMFPWIQIFLDELQEQIDEVSILANYWTRDTNGIYPTVLGDKLGLGIAIPTEALHVVGNVNYTNALMPGGVAGPTGYLLTGEGAGVANTWTNPTTLTPWSTDGTHVWRPTGNVGIGIAAPLHNLHSYGGSNMFEGSGSSSTVFLKNTSGTNSLITNTLGLQIESFSNNTWFNKASVNNGIFVNDNTAASRYAYVTGQSFTMTDAGTLKAVFSGIGFSYINRTSDNRFGIGTDAPAYDLHIKDTAATPYFAIENSSNLWQFYPSVNDLNYRPISNDGNLYWRNLANTVVMRSYTGDGRFWLPLYGVGTHTGTLAGLTGFKSDGQLIEPTPADVGTWLGGAGGVLWMESGVGIKTITDGNEVGIGREPVTDVMLAIEAQSTTGAIMEGYNSNNIRTFRLDHSTNEPFLQLRNNADNTLLEYNATGTTAYWKGNMGFGGTITSPNYQVEAGGYNSGTGIDDHYYMGVNNTNSSGLADYVASFAFEVDDVVRGTIQGQRSSSDFAGALNFGTSNSVGTMVKAMTIDSLQNVGIGTATPNELLEVKGTNTHGSLSLSNSDTSLSDTDYLGKIGFRTNDTSTGDVIVASIDAIAEGDHGGVTAPTALVFSTHNTNASGLLERMRIDNSGNVGIGTATPSTLLEVTGTTLINNQSASSTLQVQNNTNIWSLYGLHSTDDFIVKPSTSNGVFKFRDIADGDILTIDTANGDITRTGFIQGSTTSGITASTTQTQGNGALTTQINEISTVANTGDTLTAPAAVEGRRFTVINNGANTLQIFPASGDDLGFGLNISTELEPNESIIFVAYDSTNWHVEASTEIIHAEMHDEDNTDVFVITDAGTDFQVYHSNGLAAGDLAGWSFDAGGAGTSFPIASIADGAASGVDIAVTTTGTHGLAIGDIISQSNLSDAAYTGVFVVKDIISTTVYEVEAVFTATDTGTMDQAATLNELVGESGVYQITWSCSATSASSNETFDFQLYKDADPIVGSKVRRKFGTGGDFGSFGGTSIVSVQDGSKVSLGLSNTNSAGNITLRNLTIVLIRL